MNNLLSTKAQTLKRIRSLLHKSIILPQIDFTVHEWKENQEKIINQIINWKNVDKIIIRSSSKQEDTPEQSLAGHFPSYQDIPKDNKKIIAFVEKLISFYPEKINYQNEVLIQPFLNDPELFGVAFTHDPNSWKPYYIVNYDNKSKRTDSITKGNASNPKSKVIYRDHKSNDKMFNDLINAFKEIEHIVNYKYLNIEFAIKESKIYIFQVRPLVQAKIDCNSIFPELQKIERQIIQLQKTVCNLCGVTTILSNMSDWNPAEMIGPKPTTLSRSLYEYLITDKTWAKQRKKYGYRDLTKHPLMITLQNIPYIDLRISFNSLIPQTLNNNISEKLVNYYIQSIKNKPDDFDKIEFNTVLSCFVFDIDNQLAKLPNKLFSTQELNTIKKELISLTKNILKNNSVFHKDLKTIENLPQTSFVNNFPNSLDSTFDILNQCKNLGVLSFAGIARCAFISVQMLESLVRCGILSNKEKLTFLSSIKTISKEMQSDLRKLDKNVFLKKYGHLRPRTYDVMSQTYREDYSNFFNIKSAKQDNTYSEFQLNNTHRNKINNILKQNKISISADELFDFFVSAIHGREYSKFIFSKGLSLAIEELKQFCSHNNIPREMTSYLNIKMLLDLKSHDITPGILETINQNIKKNYEEHKITKLIRLPQVITNPISVFEYTTLVNRPSYITNLKYAGEIAKEKDLKTSSLQGKIILLKYADPGYDWIFTQKISGLITMYGGCNSHMAIRAYENKIPTAVGIGESFYERLQAAFKIELDCEMERINIII